jgi:heptose-I-phosphate ethanolaminephosphotransferase
MQFKIKEYQPYYTAGLKLVLPLILFVVLCLFLVPYWYSFIREAISFSILTFICFLVLLLVNKSKWNTIVGTIFFLVLTLVSVLKLSFYSIFSAKISSSSLFVLFETNFNEASEFLFSYLNTKVILVFVLHFILLVVYVFKIRFIAVGPNKLSILKKIVCIILIFVSFYTLKRKFNEQSLIFNISNSLTEYQAVKSDMKKDLAQSNSKAIKNIQSNNSTEIGVVIIGESTTRWHMGLYDYSRKTSPLLSEIKEELSVFTNVISPSVMTIKSLEKVLTMKTLENETIKDNFSIVQLANASGYSTHWISNQKPVGFTESVPTLIAQASNYKKFRATDSYVYTIYDEALLPELASTLKNAEGKHLIFIHLIGTHRTYNKRYPEKFNVFNENVENTFSTRASKFVNHYDNAVLYNDFIVRSVIEQVRATQKNSFVVYFSDHGDDVFDTQDFVGHYGGKASKPMFDVPFVLWTSKKENSFTKSQLNQPYLLDDFPHSFSDLIQTRFDGFNPEKSIFNYAFKPKKRQLTKTINYDTWK